jgi:hypothetical protein
MSRWLQLGVSGLTAFGMATGHAACSIVVESGGSLAYRPYMPLPPRIVLHSPVSDCAALAEFVERSVRDGVRLIAIAGAGAERLELEVDLLVIGDGNDQSRFLVTSAHTDEPLEDVLEFASSWLCERDGMLEVRL